ncbi:MAG: hypothetical protein MUC79_14290 [Thiobacillaceae bacterium]|jgi:hypothetical protein|nr:hypothetical protein [Thiobacillaceae bacterium]
MNKQQHPQPDLPRDVQQNSPSVDQSRRSFGKAGLAAPVVLATLASRPVLGATCLTPSAAGSGNHSQHNPVACTPKNPAWWLANVPKKSNGNIDTDAKWPGTSYKTGDLFHPLFTATSSFEYKDGAGTAGNSYNLYEVLSGRNINGGGQDQGPISNYTDSSAIGPWFVAGLLNASAGNYGGVIQAIGPDPSVRGIQDEFARNGFFAPTAGKKWYADTIKAYLNDPGSVF